MVFAGQLGLLTPYLAIMRERPRSRHSSSVAHFSKAEWTFHTA